VSVRWGRPLSLVGLTYELEEDVFQVDRRHQPVDYETVPGCELADLYGRGVDDELLVDGTVAMARRAERRGESVRFGGSDARADAGFGPQLGEPG
jgi:hypothetical protein